MQLARDLINFLSNLCRNNFMIWSMVARDIQARYVGSFLGLFWSIIHPLTQIIIYYFVFSVILNIRLGPEYGGASFAAWLVSGLLPWIFFAEVVTRSPGAVLEQSSLITKMFFPSEILPFVHLLAALINHVIGMVLFVGFLLVFGYHISLYILMVLPYLLATGVFALGIAWILSALNVFLRDIGQVIGVIVNLWFFLTPIVYPRHQVPQALQTLYGLNPMLHVVEGYRMALLGKTPPDLEGLAYLVLLNVAAVALGGVIFKKLKPAFADVL